MTFDEVLTTLSNGTTPVQDSNGWLTRCPLCPGYLRVRKKNKSLSTVLCEGQQCSVFDVLQARGMTLDDLNNVNGNGHRPKKAPAAQAPPVSQSPPPAQAPPIPPQVAPAPAATPSAMPEFRHSDYENAERLIRRHGENLRYCEIWKRWLIWTGTHWEEDKTQGVVRLAKETVRHIYAEAANTIDPHDRKALITHGVKSESSGRISAMIALAESEPSIPVIPEALDLNNWLLPCPNGTVDLKTGALVPPLREYLLTKLCPTNFDPNAQAPTWENFLNKIFKGQTPLIEFVQRIAGYSLSGETNERSLFILYGKGRNGKSTLLDVLSRVIGKNYATTTSAELLLAKPNMQDLAMSAYLAELKGYRLVACSETEDGKRLAEASVKSMTGNEEISAKRLYSQPFSYRPQFKVWLATNHRPDIRGTDEAIWDRIKLIPFEVRIPDDEVNPNLVHELAAEAEGILAWMVRGCLEWQKAGLGTPGDVVSATKNYRAEMDTFQAFIDDALIVEDTCRAKAGAVYETYRKWCDQTGEFCQKQRWVGQRLADLGFQKSKGTNGVRFWDGIGIKAQPSNSDDEDLPF